MKRDKRTLMNLNRCRTMKDIIIIHLRREEMFYEGNRNANAMG